MFSIDIWLGPCSHFHRKEYGELRIQIHSNLFGQIINHHRECFSGKQIIFLLIDFHLKKILWIYFKKSKELQFQRNKILNYISKKKNS